MADLLTDEPKRYVSPDEKLARAEERIELLEAEHDALKRQDESRCRAWAVGMLREEARKAKAAREGLTEHGAQTHSRWMRLHFRETDYVEIADEIDQEASDGD